MKKLLLLMLFPMLMYPQKLLLRNGATVNTVVLFGDPNDTLATTAMTREIIAGYNIGPSVPINTDSIYHRIDTKLSISDSTNFNSKTLTTAQLALKQNTISNLGDTTKYYRQGSSPRFNEASFDGAVTVNSLVVPSNQMVEIGNTWIFYNTPTSNLYFVGIGSTLLVRFNAASGTTTFGGSISGPDYNNTNWDTAYSWGSHALAGYVTGTPWATYFPNPADTAKYAKKTDVINVDSSQYSTVYARNKAIADSIKRHIMDMTGLTIGNLMMLLNDSTITNGPKFRGTETDTVALMSDLSGTPGSPSSYLQAIRDSIKFHSIETSGLTTNHLIKVLNDSTYTNGPIVRGTATDSVALKSDLDSIGVIAVVDSFYTSAVIDTVAWAGMHYYDKVFVSSMGKTRIDTLNLWPLSVTPDTGRVYVTRKYGNESNQKYCLTRYAGTAPTEAPPPSGGIELNSASSTIGDATGSHTTRSWSVTVASGSNRYAIFNHYNYGVSVDLDSVKLGTQKFVMIGRQGQVQQWGLIAPSVGTATLQWWCATTHYDASGLTVFNGVHQTTPTGTQVGEAATSADPTVNVTTVSGDMVVDIIGNSFPYSLTAGAGQTKTWELGNDVGAAATYKLATTTTTTMSGTLAGSTLYFHAAIPLKAAQ